MLWTLLQQKLYAYVELPQTGGVFGVPLCDPLSAFADLI